MNVAVVKLTTFRSKNTFHSKNPQTKSYNIPLQKPNSLNQLKTCICWIVSTINTKSSPLDVNLEYKSHCHQIYEPTHLFLENFGKYIQLVTQCD